MQERPYRISHQFRDVTLTEATEENRRWYVARMRCPVCSMLVVREHRAPVGAETLVLRAVQDHLEMAHGHGP